MKDADQKVEITILNWDKHQREMKGGEKRRRSREWVAISSRIYSDPDFLRLTMEQRYLWLMLVCYAGAVGPVFKLSPSDARVLFKLRKSAVFQPLVNQGFIDLRAATNKTDITNKTVKKNIQKERSSKRVPASWVLSDKGREFARGKGMSAGQIETELQSFRDYEYKAAKKDFDACWRTWCTNWKKFGGKSDTDPRIRVQ